MIYFAYNICFYPVSELVQICFDDIIDCSLSEINRICCLKLPTSVHNVEISAPLGNKDPEDRRPELTLVGLRHPHDFQKLLMQVKSFNRSIGTISNQLEVVPQSMSRNAYSTTLTTVATRTANSIGSF
jgi:hypothetical protein